MKYKKLITLFVISLLFNITSAQIDGDPDTGSSIPVDGGIVTITLIAAAYGAKRHKENKDKSL
ncbi:MAG: hypothetical protein RL411_1344 [Bacteroidota bacterium]